MINIDKRALRESAERAGQNDWEYVYTSDLSAPGRGYITVGGAEAIYCLNKAAGGVKQSENVLRYIAAASPETMLALLNEIAELEQRHCGTALLEREEMHTKTLGRMLDELEESERLRLKFQEANCELCQKLEAAEKRIAELERNEIREEGNQFLVVRHPGKAPVIKHCAGDLEGFLRQLLEHDPMSTIDIVTHRYYGVGGQWVQDADEYLHMMTAAAGKGE